MIAYYYWAFVSSLDLLLPSSPYILSNTASSQKKRILFSEFAGILFYENGLAYEYVERNVD